MLCEENRRHVELIPADYVKGVEFIYVTKMDQVIENALGFLVF